VDNSRKAERIGFDLEIGHPGSVCFMFFLQFMQVLFFHCLTCMMCNEVQREKPLRSCRAGLVGIIGP